MKLKPLTVKQQLKKFYNDLGNAKQIVIENDKNLFKNQKDLSFKTRLAYSSELTEYVSTKGHKIRFSYVSWRDEWFQSTDRNNLKYFNNELIESVGGICFECWNNRDDLSNYIIALNKDVYAKLPQEDLDLTFAHELGHCILDHLLLLHNKEFNERSIQLEIDADTMGFNSLKVKGEFKNESYKDPKLLTNEYFTKIFILNWGSLIYGSENIKSISKIWNESETTTVEKLFDRYYERDIGNGYEIRKRYENFQSFLKTCQ